MGAVIKAANEAKIPSVSAFSGDVPGITADIGANGVSDGAILAAEMKSAINYKGRGGKRRAEDYKQEVSHIAARRAYEMAGVAPNDVSVAEVHNATALGEIQQSENLMLCGFGEGGPLGESGATKIGGRIPINPSGGLESKGHPIGATGLGQIYELVTQLRGEAGTRQVENAKIAVAENGGGLIGVESAACCVTILGR